MKRKQLRFVGYCLTIGLIACFTMGVVGCSLITPSPSLPVISTEQFIPSTPTSTITLHKTTTKVQPTSTSYGEIKLADGAIAVNGIMNPIVLQYNSQAINPSYAQLMAFLNQDNTDTIPYTSTFVCADFANTLYNDAESDGIRASVVILDGIDHAINAFQTTDNGSIYIDFTGNDPSLIQAVPPGETTFGTPNNHKKVAYLQVGKPLGLISLDAANNYGFQYSGYEQWENDKQIFDSDLSSYNNQMTIYNNEVETDNANGGVVTNSPEYLRLQSMSNSLAQLNQQINNLATKLGAFWMPPDETITGIEVFWQGNY